MKAMAVPFLKSMFALALFAGLQGTVQAQSAQAAYSNSWAGGNLSAPAMVVGVKSCLYNGMETGGFNVRTATYSAYGQCFASSLSYDSVGSHAVVKANVTFNNAQPAIATMVMTVYPDGSSAEGVEITDPLTGAVLAGTGRDNADNLIELPVIHGSIFITPQAAPSAF